MEWSAISAKNAYLDALKLCNRCRKECNSSKSENIPESNEFISALAAGMSAKLIVEITSELSLSTVALAAAARQTGGKLISIIPEKYLQKSQKIIQDSGLIDTVEFKIGDPVKALLDYKNIDFSLVDCRADDYGRFLQALEVNPKRAVVVANNLLEGEKGLEGHLKGVEKKTIVKSMKHPIGEGMEITMIGKSNGVGEREKSRSDGYYCFSSSRNGGAVKKTDNKSKWIYQVDEKSGEEHIFRMPRSQE